MGKYVFENQNYHSYLHTYTLNYYSLGFVGRSKVNIELIQFLGKIQKNANRDGCPWII